MRKAVVTAFGDISNLKIVTAEIAAPAPKEVQVQIIYAGFSGADVNMRLGRYPNQKGAPLTPGYNFVGRVVKNGSACSKNLAPGTIVTAVTTYDSDAELINIAEKYLVLVLDGVDLKKAAALTLDWNTAYGMVTHAAKVTKGQRVFIHGLSGAVGNATRELCKLQGAEVYGTASERNHAALRETGATPFVYTDKKWIESMKELGGVHAVFDPLGFESWDESFSILSVDEKSVLVGYGGNLATLNGGPDRSIVLPTVKLLSRNLVIGCPRRTTFYYISRDSKNFESDLLECMKLTKEGKIDVPIKGVWDLDNVGEAHESWGKSSGMGSMVIRIRDE